MALFDGDSDLDRRSRLLLDMLEVAVFVEQANVVERPLDDLVAVGRESLETLLETGEAFLYRRRKGETPQAFAAIARALAALACWPGGVRFCGRRWVVTHPEGQALGWYEQCGAGGKNAWPEG